MMKVRYTTQWYKNGYQFPLVEVFKTYREMRQWEATMKERYGSNFRILHTWEDFHIPTPSIKTIARPKQDGSTDACILGMDY